MNPSTPQQQSGIQANPSGKVSDPPNKFLLKLHYFPDDRGGQDRRLVAVEGQIKIDGKTIHSFSDKEIMSPYIPRIALLLISWRQEKETEFRIKLPVWEKLGDLLRGTTVPDWLKGCFGSRETLEELLSRSRGLIHVNESFHRDDVEIVVIEKPGIKDNAEIQLSADQSIQILKSVVGLDDGQSITSDHQEFIESIVEELLGITLTARDTKLVGKSVWLSHLTRLEKIVEQFLVGENGLIETLVEETERLGGGFDRDTASNYYAKINAVIKRINSDFSDEALRLDFDTKDFTKQLREIQRVLNELESILPCGKCKAVENAPIEQDLIRAEFAKLHKAAVSARSEIKKLKPRLSQIIRGCRKVLENLVKQNGL